MRGIIKIVLLLLLPGLVNAQNRLQIDSVILVLQKATNDTVRLDACSFLGGAYDDINVDSGLYYCDQGIAIAEKLDLPLNKATVLAFKAWPLMKTGNYPEALKVINQGLKIAEDPINEQKTAYLLSGQTLHSYRLYVIGLLYSALESLYGYVGDYEKQIATAREAIPHVEASGDIQNLAGIYPDIGDCYLKLNKLDSALFYHLKALEYYPKMSFEERKFEGSSYTSIGMIYEKMGNRDLARENYLKAIRVSELRDNPRHAGNACLQLANQYQSSGNADSAFLYAKKAMHAFTRGGYKREIAVAYRMISDYYHDEKNTDSSYTYLRRATVLDDSLDKVEKAKLQEFQVAAFNQQLALQEQEQERISKEGRLKTFAIVALIAIFGTIGFLLYRNNRQKQRTNKALQEKNSQIENTLRDLRATQRQLIQSEKMASLGELTAGIAHEIQNPLNFVNNFSDVNTELADELQEELNKGDLESARTIARDIKDNEAKINQHGKRADAIVKGMLQHSRSGTGQKEPTDINALCDEYLRLAYHGLRAKDKSFQSGFETQLDPEVGMISVMPQEIGRVILNLINNAFYAVAEKKKSDGEGYEPMVKVTTRRKEDKIEIEVKDNGNGIPETVRDKIFQPFFTTKPTGQGTGLGLSLSYDIIKAHGGKISLDSKQNEGLSDGQTGTAFIVQLPA